MATLYGNRSATFSVHLLLHLPTSVLYNGPLWCHSCFFFEDQNGELRQYFHSSQHPDSQVVRAVSIVQSLPKMEEEMESGSLAENLYRSITADRYKVKCVGQVDKDGSALLGQPEDVSEDLQLQQYTGPIYKYKRALVHGEVFHSFQYLKAFKRYSYNVMYLGENSEIMYGQVQCFLKLANGNFAMIRPYRPKPKEIVSDKTTGTISARHFIVLEKEPSQEYLVPVSRLQSMVLIMSVSGLDFAICAFVSNSIEKD